MPVPPLLRAVSKFVAGCGHGTLGWFDALRGSPPTRTWSTITTRLPKSAIEPLVWIVI
jgi:hypothetical protein